MASDLGAPAALSGIPAVPQSPGLTGARVGGFDAALSVAAAVPGPAQVAPFGTPALSVSAAIRDLERQAAVLKPGAAEMRSQGPRTSGLGAAAPETDQARQIDHLVGVAQQNLQLIVWSQVVGNTVAKPAEVFSKLTQG